MILRPPRATRTDTLCTYTTLVRARRRLQPAQLATLVALQQALKAHRPDLLAYPCRPHPRPQKAISLETFQNRSLRALPKPDKSHATYTGPCEACGATAAPIESTGFVCDLYRGLTTSHTRHAPCHRRRRPGIGIGRAAWR